MVEARKHMLKKIAGSAAMVFLCLPLTGLAAQGEAAPSRSQLPQFHNLHVNEVEIGCTDCHAVADNPAPGMELSFTKRPMHENCNICHEDTFDAGEFVTLCLTCHSNDSFDLGSFPSGNGSIGVFSHEKHVDPKGRVSKSTGQRQDCVFCHKVDASQTDPGLPGHSECKACHANANAVHPAIAKGGDSSCQGCHDLKRIDHTIKTRGADEMMAGGLLPPWLAAAPAPAAPEQGEGGAYKGSGHLGSSWEDVKRFPHGKHVQERNGAGINCIVCHDPVTHQQAQGEAVPYPKMDDCAVCHQTASRVGAENTIEKCETCHLEINAFTVPGSEGRVAHIAHNSGFKTNHQGPARNSGNYCSYCHDLQRNTANVCADCHQLLKPETHQAARFAETTHGRLAAMDRENCATCHESDFCVRCHNIPPRSHNPLPLFAAGLHRDLAALNLRSCFTCHTFEANCRECHERTLREP